MLAQHHVEVENRHGQFVLAGLELRDIDHIVDNAQQLLRIFLDEPHEHLVLIALGNFVKNAGEAHDGIERGADFVADIGQESRLQAVALLGSVARLDQGFLHLLTVVDAHGGTHDAQGLAIGIALGNGGIAFFPIKLIGMGNDDAIGFVIVADSTLANILQRAHDARRILLENVTVHVVEGDNGVHLHAEEALLLEVVVDNCRTGYGVDMPRSQAHGLDDELVLDVAFLDFAQLCKLALQFAAAAPLPVEQHNAGNQGQHHQHAQQQLARRGVSTYI